MVVENRGRLINYGVIQADVPGEVLTLQAMVPMPNNFENYGELRAINGGTLFIPSIAGLGGDATVVGAGSVLQLSTANANAQPYTLNGTMNVSGGGRLSLGNHATITGTRYRIELTKTRCSRKV